MFNIENFESIFNLIEKNDKFSSQKQLALLRKKYALHPDYLFLMSKYLILDKRYYQSIDTLLGSLKLDKDELFLVKNNFKKSKEELITKKIQLIGKLFNLIGNMELSIEASKIKSENERNNYVNKLSKLMPGVKLKKN
jgi:hypothetical protein|tara:strand:+ start:91 stop:504 length:414 start_codon:yes stop_codon:yes gene_type:complete